MSSIRSTSSTEIAGLSEWNSYKSADGGQALGLVIDRAGVVLENLIFAGARGVLQIEDGLWVKQVEVLRELSS